LYIASLLSSTQMRTTTKEWKTYFIFLSVSGIVAALIFFQPATTMALIVVGSGVLMYFLSGAAWKHIMVSLLVALVVFLGLVTVTPYRFHRVAPFWNATIGAAIPRLSLPAASSTGDQFHHDQSMNAIGSGGVWGVGFGKSTSKYSVLPEPMGDSIFAVIAEEEGFVGSIFIILAFIIFIWRGTIIALKSHDDFARLSIIGFVSVFCIQAIIHIAANSGAMPFTGVPLPFVSYGGTAMAVSLTMVGLIANISKYTTA
jgi:cell division protein FtsW